MKVWIEWKVWQEVDFDHPPRMPNVFTTRENLVEYWKRRRFPADTVDRLFKEYDEFSSEYIEHDGWVAAEVEVDDYFVRKVKEACRADCPMRNTSKDGCKYYEGGNCTKVVTPTNVYAKCIYDLREKEKEDKPCII